MMRNGNFCEHIRDTKPSFFDFEMWAYEIYTGTSQTQSILYVYMLPAIEYSCQQFQDTEMALQMKIMGFTWAGTTRSVTVIEMSDQNVNKQRENPGGHLDMDLSTPLLHRLLLFNSFQLWNEFFMRQFWRVPAVTPMPACSQLMIQYSPSVGYNP